MFAGEAAGEGTNNPGELISHLVNSSLRRYLTSHDSYAIL
jgi:hypothetical protein